METVLQLIIGKESMCPFNRRITRIFMKNRKMSVAITTAILLVNIACIFLLYIIAETNLTRMMKSTEMEHLHASLNVQTNIIEEYIEHQEDLLIAFSDSPVIVEFLKDPSNTKKAEAAQEYTQRYYSRLDNWEGLYVGEWNTHVIAHSNPDVVGMYTRKGEPLKQLQEAMLSRNGLYNAGMIVSPASQKLVLSLYCPVFDYDGETIVGYVGGGPFAEGLDILMSSVKEETAKYYMLNVDLQRYIFAQEDDLMATEIEDEMLLSIIHTITAGENPQKGDIEYIHEEDGKSIAAYQYIPQYGWAVVSCNSEKNIYADVDKNMKLLGIICIFSELLIGTLSWFFIQLSTKPLKYVERAIIQLKDMKLTKDPKLDKYINGTSEVGQIATAIDSLYDSIKDMLQAEKEKQIAIAESESKAKFLASMSHEIRTPINTVMGMNEMILRENKDETIREYAYNIKSASQMLLALVNDILDISKMDAGKLRIVESDYRVATMLDEVILAIEAMVKQKNLQLKLDIEESLPSVLKGDAMRIKQVLNNLLTNAAKYTKEGSITLCVKGVRREDAFYLIMSVTDTGIGIRKEDMERLFERFLRLELDKNRYIEGTGLGLNIAKQLIDNMNGRIDVTSEYGKGSCFSVELPQTIIDDTPMGSLQHTLKNKMQTEDKKNYFQASQAKILVVDDNKMNLTVMKALLKRSKVQVECAGGGNECLQMTKSKKYDLILMDHMMPQPDGIETLHLMQKDEENPNRDTTVIVITANAIPGIEEGYLKEGFAGYLSKPVIADKLEEMLTRFLTQEPTETK